jgi:hypothetical protein
MMALKVPLHQDLAVKWSCSDDAAASAVYMV